ncbi:hypothetical protein QZJ86_12065 [Methylomonas montana]|uniref:hypothetical protein n=1 Tax=Methylomonas montana TaxID=3058963 RepID=UPI00265B3B64|nr:hypothetical protein [Methylomonas montana]WKJ88757.1 hypothetical protein QZJ86_12065 [Methylomonas montana]
MATAIDICNLSLAKLGDEARVTSIAPPDTSMQAQYCALFYSQSLNVMLDKHAWAFATVTVTLTALTTNPNPFWAYAYSLPTDFFGVNDVRSSGYIEETQTPPTQNYALEGSTLYSNIADAVLVYTSSLATDPAKFPPLFIEALSTLLASYLAGPILKGDVGVAAQRSMMQAFITTALPEAITSDCQYRKVRPQYTPSGIAARA